MKNFNRFYIATSAKSFADFKQKVNKKSVIVSNHYILVVLQQFNTLTKSMSFCDKIKLNYITTNEVLVSLDFSLEIIDGNELYKLCILTSDDYNNIH